MKYVRQFLIILFISLMGEILKYFLPLPIPASIYGMVLMFAALKSGIIKLASVKETAHFLIDIMPIMFIPAGVGLMDSVGTLKSILIPVFVITVVTNITVMGVTGCVAQTMRKGADAHE